MKEYILVLLSVIGIGLVATPNLSMAEAQEISSMQVAEVADFAEISKISEKNIESIAESASITTPVRTARTTSGSVSSVAVNSFDYTVTRTPSRVEVDPGNYINKTGKLVYAHNDPSLMLSALSLKAGSTFTVTENGVTNTYTVSVAKVYAKTELEAIIPGKNYNRMSEVAYSAKDDNGKTHKIALMTCYERARQAAHRYVVYAD